MNERIKELAEQAEKLKRDEVSYLERLHNRYYTGDMEEEIFREKFAELIVRECVLHLHKRGIEGFGILEERNLKEHFGVEE